MRKTFFYITFLLILSLLLLSLISFASAEKVSGSFTITGEAVEEVNSELLAEEDTSFLNSIKNFFIYAFTLGGEFEISPPSGGEETAEKGGGGGGSSSIESIELKNKSDNQSIDSNKTNKTTEETPKETETPLKPKESQTIFIIIIILIIIVLFLLKRKISKLFKGKVKPEKRKRK